VQSLQREREERQASFNRESRGAVDDDNPDSERFAFNSWVRIDCYKSKYDTDAVVKASLISQYSFINCKST